MIVVLYRISPLAQKTPGATSGKHKPEYITKMSCLRNMLRAIRQCREEVELVVIQDRCSESFLAEMDQAFADESVHPRDRISTDFGNGAGSTRAAMEWVVARFGDETLDRDAVVYLVEDDYLHVPDKSLDCIAEGARRFDFATGYDHPDKYDNANMVVENGTEVGCTLHLGTRCHWKQTTSTTMTFASKAHVLCECHALMLPYLEGDFPHDMYLFSALTAIHGKTLVSAVPAVCTHGETAFLAPVPHAFPLTPLQYWKTVASWETEVWRRAESSDEEESETCPPGDSEPKSGETAFLQDESSTVSPPLTDQLHDGEWELEEIASDSTHDTFSPPSISPSDTGDIQAPETEQPPQDREEGRL